MATTLLARPHVVALLASRAHIFSSRALPCFLATKRLHPLTPPVLVLVSERSCGTMLQLCPGSQQSFSIQATTQVNDSGSVDSPLMQSMEKKIKEHLNAVAVNVKDAYGDGRHVSINVISSAFEGQSPVNRQRMVYKAIWEELQNTVHAVDQMTTKTPMEAAAEK